MWHKHVAKSDILQWTFKSKAFISNIMSFRDIIRDFSLWRWSRNSLRAILISEESSQTKEKSNQVKRCEGGDDVPIKFIVKGIVIHNSVKITLPKSLRSNMSLVQLVERHFVTKPENYFKMNSRISQNWHTVVADWLCTVDFYGVKWSKSEVFFDISELIQSKKTMLSRKGIFSRFYFTHKYSDFIHNQQLIETVKKM